MKKAFLIVWMIFGSAMAMACSAVASVCAAGVPFNQDKVIAGGLPFPVLPVHPCHGRHAKMGQTYLRSMECRLNFQHVIFLKRIMYQHIEGLPQLVQFGLDPYRISPPDFSLNHYLQYERHHVHA